jgi:O-antigen/teichoic acid export membrane protein
MPRQEPTEDPIGEPLGQSLGDPADESAHAATATTDSVEGTVAAELAEVVGSEVTSVKATGLVALGMVAMNALAYGFTLVAAHVLGPDDFGAVNALLGILMVTAVPALAVQATAARRLATSHPDHWQGVIRDVLMSAAKVTVGITVVLLALTPVINQVLHLDDVVAAAMVSVATIAVTMMGAYAGITQGQRRWSAMTAIYAGLGAGRLVGGVVGMLVDPSPRGAMVGLAVGTLVPLGIGAAATRLPGPQPQSDHAPIVRELWRNGHILLAFFVFTNLDVLLARHLFDANDAGVYAAGSIIAKSCLFLPTFVLVVAFPTMAVDRAGRPWVKPMLAVLGLGAVAVLGAWMLPDLAVAFAGGSEYDALGDVAWLFALEGTIFAALQILVYDTIAGQTHAGSLLWLGAAVVAGLAIPLLDTVTGLVTVVTVVAFGVGLVTSLMPGVSHPD